MPTYEYVCTDCANQWEEIQKISENPIELCPKCGKSTAKRQISGGNFILKGGGWYADLYSSTPKKSGDSSGASAKSEGSSSSTNKSETSSSSSASAPASATPTSTPSAAGSK